MGNEEEEIEAAWSEFQQALNMSEEGIIALAVGLATVVIIVIVVVALVRYKRKARRREVVDDLDNKAVGHTNVRAKIAHHHRRRSGFRQSDYAPQVSKSSSGQARVLPVTESEVVRYVASDNEDENDSGSSGSDSAEGRSSSSGDERNDNSHHRSQETQIAIPQQSSPKHSRRQSEIPVVSPKKRRRSSKHHRRKSVPARVVVKRNSVYPDFNDPFTRQFLHEDTVPTDGSPITGMAPTASAHRATRATRHTSINNVVPLHSHKRHEYRLGIDLDMNEVAEQAWNENQAQLGDGRRKRNARHTRR